MIRKPRLPEVGAKPDAATEALRSKMKCKTHPDAPHGFDRNASHSQDRYVCECESWEPPEQTKPMGVSCPRCGKTGLQPDSIHTCTPLALVLADELTTLTGTQKAKRTTAKQAADELRRLHAANMDCIAWFDALKSDYDAQQALLRQALEALDWIVTGRGHDTIETAHAAIRTRLGETK